VLNTRVKILPFAFPLAINLISLRFPFVSPFDDVQNEKYSTMNICVEKKTQLDATEWFIALII